MAAYAIPSKKPFVGKRTLIKRPPRRKERTANASGISEDPYGPAGRI